MYIIKTFSSMGAWDYSEQTLVIRLEGIFYNAVINAVSRMCRTEVGILFNLKSIAFLKYKNYIIIIRNNNNIRVYTVRFRCRN